MVAQDPPAGGPNECQANASPFIDQCGYDQAGIILQHIYGALNAPNRGALDGTVRQFAQSLYSKPNSVSSLSLGNTGYVFVFKECGQGETCRVHIALYGCKQGVGDIDRRFVDYGGYNAWADTNRIIVLYPQPPPAGIPSARKPAWSYVDYDDRYVTKSGSQIRTSRRCSTRLPGARRRRRLPPLLRTRAPTGSRSSTPRIPPPIFPGPHSRA